MSAPRDRVGQSTGDALTSDPGPRWVAGAAHRLWLAQEGERLFEFHRRARLAAGGFGALDGSGRLLDAGVADTLITARMVHACSLAALQGIPGAAPLAAHGVAALRGCLHDPEYGGWFASAPVGDDAKPCYLHLFVVLGAASACQASVDGADALLASALKVLEARFWSPDEAAFVEGWDRAWQAPVDYRGGNANMHGVEVLLELADVLQDNAWRERALAIAERLIHRHARANGYHVVEHFDGRWQQRRDFNAETPDDGFRPYGVTPGHGFEWARLLLHLEAGLQRAGTRAPDWLAVDARGLFAAATAGWGADGRPGLVYTLDWDGQVVLTRRRHWTHCELVAAAAALAARTGEPGYERWYRRAWDFIADVFIDRARGGWRQELDQNLAPDPLAGDVKPDFYHAYQATLLPTMPLAPTLAVAVAGAPRSQPAPAPELGA